MTTKTEDPAGFPRCPKCAFLSTGTAQVCYRCASQTFTAASNPCPVCTREMDSPDREHCRNPLCGHLDRFIARIDSVADKTGPIDDKIQALKYRDRRGWLPIFGRIVLGYLDGHRDIDEFDLIVANPTYDDTTMSNPIRHTEWVIEAAAREDVLGRWPFDVAEPRAIVKTQATAKSARGSYQAKLEAAQALYEALAIPDPSRTAGKSILIYDDICTTGHQLNKVAECLHLVGGAKHVEGLVLARATYGG